MRGILRPLLLPFLRRNPNEVEKQSRLFRVHSPEGRELVADVGRAFLGGYHAMLEARDLRRVAASGENVPVHFRPFFFEGAAMGYLPRAYFDRGLAPRRVEADLLALDPRYRYLYCVGLGFWFGFRHPRRPESLEALANAVDPMYFPLCYDGYGFKLGFFDFPKRPEAARRVLRGAPATCRGPILQGFGRALFFVFMEDEASFERELSAASPDERDDLESGRSLALAFTGLRHPESILDHLATARDEADRGSRLLGVTWALTAREMNDPAHFERCLASLGGEQAERLRALPRLCRDALAASRSYDDWRETTRSSAVRADFGARDGRRS